MTMTELIEAKRLIKKHFNLTDREISLLKVVDFVHYYEAAKKKEKKNEIKTRN